MKNPVIQLFLFVPLVLAFSCKQDPCGYQPENVEPQVDIEIRRLESEMLQLKTRDQVREFMISEPLITENFLLKSQYPNDSIFIEEMVRRFTNPHIDSLRMEIETRFADLSWLETELEEAFNLMKFYYPETQVPRVTTVATGFDYDMVVTDEEIIIGLDYYLGDESKYRPMNTYNYILKRYQPKFIVPSIMLLSGISTYYNKTDKEDISILSDMVTYGKSFYFAKRMLPCTPDSVLLWYSDKEMEGLDENGDIVWSHFLSENLLWETSHIVKRKYLDERPKTYEIGPACPPRIATWLGWEIIQQYMEKHPEVTLQELMQLQDARKLFEEAKYRPQ